MEEEVLGPPVSQVLSPYEISSLDFSLVSVGCRRRVTDTKNKLCSLYFNIPKRIAAPLVEFRDQS
jgi:hypothetical protein